MECYPGAMGDDSDDEMEYDKKAHLSQEGPLTTLGF
jgi:hypothetical protein